MNPALGLAAARVALGSIAVAAPAVGAGLFRLDARTNPQLPYMTRLFGGREIALGLATLLTRGSAQRNLVLLGIAVDAVDAGAGVLAARQGAVDRRTGVLLTSPAVAAVLAGAAGARALT